MTTPAKSFGKEMAVIKRDYRQAQKDRATVVELAEELKRWKSRVKALRKMRDVRILTVQDPQGKVLAVLTIPTFVYEKSNVKIHEMAGRLLRDHNQVMKMEIPVPCDTFVGLQVEIDGLNQIDEKE